MPWSQSRRSPGQRKVNLRVGPTHFLLKRTELPACRVYRLMRPEWYEMTNSWPKQDVPDAAVVVAPTAESGALLAVAFDDVVVLTLDELPRLSAHVGRYSCVAITGVPTRG